MAAAARRGRARGSGATGPGIIPRHEHPSPHPADAEPSRGDIDEPAARDDLRDRLRPEALHAGTVWINRYGRSADFVIPTGGYHQSGIGKDLGRQAVEANLRFKSVLIDFAAAH